MNDGRGALSTADLADAHAAGVSDEEIAEIIGRAALKVLTYDFNKAAWVDIDFPVFPA